MTLFEFSVVPALPCYSPMSRQNWSHEHGYVALLDMALNIKDIDVVVPCLNDLGFLIMLSFGNIRCSPHYLPFIYEGPKHIILLTFPLIFFQPLMIAFL